MIIFFKISNDVLIYLFQGSKYTEWLREKDMAMVEAISDLLVLDVQKISTTPNSAGLGVDAEYLLVLDLPKSWDSSVKVAVSTSPK